jgi:hypothetical protein
MTATLKAHALAALPNVAVGELPTDIQMFPPGEAVEFTLQDYPGETFTMTVDEAVAAKAQADLERMQAAERAGRAAAPFADKNHEDAEATFRPLRIFWAGNDPKAGGVRVQAEWTPFGAALVKAKAFKYFSGNFLFSKTARKFLGLINENIGGLVNRPGFAAQQAFAKADDIATPWLVSDADVARLEKKYDVDLTRPAGSLEHEFMLLVRRLQEKLAVSDSVLIPQLKESEPALWDAYIGLLTGSSISNSKELADTLSALAKAHQHRAGGSFNDAWQAARKEIFVTAGEQRSANTIYNRTMELRHREGLDFTAAHARATVEHHTKAAVNKPARPYHVFMAHARAYAAAHNLTEHDGQAAFARTPEGAALYQRAV